MPGLRQREQPSSLNTRGKVQMTSPDSFDQPRHPSPELAAIIGASPVSPSDAVALFLAYVKQKGLTRPPRDVVVDSTLRRLFGGREVVSMVEIALVLYKNLTLERPDTRDTEARRNHVPPALAAIVGTQPFTRDQLLLRLYSYVQRNGLLGEETRIHVQRDANLKTLFPADERVFFADFVRRVGEILRGQMVDEEEVGEPVAKDAFPISSRDRWRSRRKPSTRSAIVKDRKR